MAEEQPERARSVWLVAKRPPLTDHPFVWRWLARLVYKQIHWTADYGIEYMGIFTDEAEARHKASGPGLFLMELPLNGLLPEETCQFGTHDFPHSEASHEYRHRDLQYTAVPNYQLNLIRGATQGLQECLDGKCAEVRG